MMTSPVDQKHKAKKASQYRPAHTSKNSKVRDYAKKVAQIVAVNGAQKTDPRVVPTEGKIKVVVSNANGRRLLRRELKVHHVENVVEFQNWKSVKAHEPLLRRNATEAKRVSPFAAGRAEALRIMLKRKPTEEDLIAEANFVASLNGVPI